MLGKEIDRLLRKLIVKLVKIAHVNEEMMTKFWLLAYRPGSHFMTYRKMVQQIKLCTSYSWL